MERVKLSDNFFLDEFIDIHTYLNEKDNGLSKIDQRLFNIAQTIREKYNSPLYINTWWGYYKKNETNLSCEEIIKNVENSSTLRKWSGLRTERCNIGAKQSAHKVGKAIDLKGDEKKLYKIIKKSPKNLYELGVRRIEEPKITKGWLHVDTLERNTIPNSIRVVDLAKMTELITWKL